MPEAQAFRDDRGQQHVIAPFEKRHWELLPEAGSLVCSTQIWCSHTNLARIGRNLEECARRSKDLQSSDHLDLQNNAAATYYLRNAYQKVSCRRLGSENPNHDQPAQTGWRVAFLSLGKVHLRICRTQGLNDEPVADMVKERRACCSLEMVRRTSTNLASSPSRVTESPNE